MNLIRGIVIFAALLLSVNVLAESKQDREIQYKLKDIQHDIDMLKDDYKDSRQDYEKIRNEQVNYQFEKNTLKENYETSYKTINTALTVAFGIVTIFAFLGLRNINEIKSEYRNELEKLTKIKTEFDSEYQKLKSSLDINNDKVKEVSERNASLDRRLEVLEIIEKCASLVRDKNYTWALEHLAIGLELDPDNIALLKLQGACVGRLGNLDEYIQILQRQLIVCEKTNLVDSTAWRGISINLAEAYALKSDRNNFNALYERNKSHIDGYLDGGLVIFFKALVEVDHSYQEALNIIKQHLQIFSEAPPKDFAKGSWFFDEAIPQINKKTNEEAKQLIFDFMKFLKGEASAKDILEKY